MKYKVPSHLKGHVTDADESTVKQIQKRYGKNVVAFTLKNKYDTIVFSHDLKTFEYGGRAWVTSKAGEELLLFDAFKHGYNGAMELNTEDEIASIQYISVSDSDVIIAFQYDGNEEHYVEEGSSKHSEDYFGNIAFYLKNDEQLKELVSFECA